VEGAGDPALEERGDPVHGRQQAVGGLGSAHEHQALGVTESSLPRSL
jgi:hypothetical protein